MPATRLATNETISYSSARPHLKGGRRKAAVDTALILRKLSVLRERPSRVVDVLREPRRMTVGPLTANRLGLQLFRVLKDRALWHTRSFELTTPEAREAYETIERDGIVVIPDFLSDADHALVQEEYAASRKDPAEGTTYFGPNFGAKELYTSDHPERYPHTNRLLRDNKLILEVAAAVPRRQQTYRPATHFFTVEKGNPDEAHVDLDGAQFVHPDRHYPFVKAFYYINDVDETNSPYCYAPGSHKIDLRRLVFEYVHSVTWSKGGRDPFHNVRTEEGIEQEKELRDLCEKYLADRGYPCKPIMAKANTLVLSNNCGFHRRGEYIGPRPRQTVQMDYKYFESRPTQWMYPVLKRLYAHP